ncbi:Response regulator receiver domain-containing protein [Colwellia chukchiensis]|uniref:Response regulator receiver domain-containing protein n=1 Tax=Colwellia chukchiensis TaxID=641665 RepID=A0A1H7Q2S7_9GAMM|nr:response regulator [Colwellia chukchiensis]SEL41775.1 Response regulator receiver domain-containing protein [Colwellia chukchiensis]
MISVLVVEDDDSKFENVKSIIEELNIPERGISRTISVQETLSALENAKFDVLILDLQIPQRVNEEKKDTGGLNVLKVIKHDVKRKGDKYKTPNVIIGLTKHTELFEEQASLFTEQRVFSYVYDHIDMTWADGIKESINEYIHSKQTSTIHKPTDKVIYSIHGIHSFGRWQGKLDEYIKEQGSEFEHIEFKYNFYPVFSFLIPPLRNREVKTFITELQDLANRNRTAEINIVAHSFGTFVAVKALEKIPLITSPKLGRVVLCGSVLKSSYQLQKIINKHEIKGIVNDCGISDKALVLSQASAVGLGMAGKVGFKNTFAGLIQNRYFEGDHGLFFNKGFFKDWLDFFSGKQLDKQDDRKDPNIWLSIKACLVLYSPLICFLAVAYLIYYICF